MLSTLKVSADHPFLPVIERRKFFFLFLYLFFTFSISRFAEYLYRLTAFFIKKNRRIRARREARIRMILVMLTKMMFFEGMNLLGT